MTSRRRELALVKWQAMAEMYRQGRNTSEIAGIFGCTHQAVSFAFKQIGISRSDSGAIEIRNAARADRLAARMADRDRKSVERWGCSHDQYVFLRDLKRPTRAFASQRKNAHQRGIEWHLNLWQWWTIWQDSGLWDERGPGRDGCCMCRHGDIGPYAIGNVYIATVSQNFKDYWAGKRKTLVRGTYA